LLLAPALTGPCGPPRLAQLLKSRQPPAAPTLLFIRLPARRPGVHQFFKRRCSPSAPDWILWNSRIEVCNALALGDLAGYLRDDDNTIRR
jgi:hypothetical protein